MALQQFDSGKAEDFAGRLFKSGVDAMDLLSVYVGDRLGLYRVLADGGPVTPAELADQAGINCRYAREWLEHQAVTGILEVDNPSLSEDLRRYSLPVAHAAALIDVESPYSISPLARFLVSGAQMLPRILEAFRTGAGIAWSDYGPDAIEAQGDFNRPWLVRQFGTEYLPSIVDVHTRLQGDPPARVADIACGVGWASIAVARAYPKVVVHGFDLDEESIAIARRNAEQAGVADRVTFEVRDAADASLQGNYNLAVVIEAIHDLAKPIEVLAAIRLLLAPGGTVIVADGRVGEAFKAPGDDAERLFYGGSVFFCLPNGMAEQPSAATGAVMRESIFRRYAEDAGFSSVEVLGIEHPMKRFYRLAP